MSSPQPSSSVHATVVAALGSATPVDTNPFEFADCFAAYRGVPSDLVIAGDEAISPEVTIAIPTYRRPDLLREAIASALALRAERPFEVIVVDNDTDPQGAATVDAIVRAFHSPHLRLFRNRQNIGMFGNWNRCIELARAPWLSILNDDDLLDPEWLETIALTGSGHEMRASRVQTFGDQPWLQRRACLDDWLKALGEWVLGRRGEYRVTPADLLAGNPVWASLGVLMNRAAAVALGGYNENLWPIADYVFNVRYALSFGISVTDRRLARYRYLENESLKHDTMSLSVKRCFFFRRALIRQLHVSRLHESILDRANERQAWLDAFSWHQRSTAFDWRAVVSELCIGSHNTGPSRLTKALVRLGWLTARPLRSAT